MPCLVYYPLADRFGAIEVVAKQIYTLPQRVTTPVLHDQ